MSYAGAGEVSAVHHPRRVQHAVEVGQTSVTVIASAQLTGGRYSLYRIDLAPQGGGAAPHFHRTFAESFQVVAGRVELFDGTSWVEGGPGDHLFVPEGGIHGFRNVRPDAAALWMMSTPGAAREAYFAELGELVDGGRQLAPEEWTELFARHDQYMV